jgi:branched-chain amino acid transport system substrate-binding protein
VNPVAAQAEALVCPCLCSFVQWRSLVSALAVTSRAPRWTYAHAIGPEDIGADFLAMWDSLLTNKKVGFAFADDPGGQMWADATAGLPQAATASGYQSVLPGLYAVSSGDYTPLIAEFKKNGCEICCGAFTTSDFIDFWRQCMDQKYRPKIATVGEGLLFPHALEAIGPSARNLTAECLWQPTWPFRDSITGMTCQELANDYMARTGDQWTAAIAQYAKFEWAVDVFKRVTDINSRREIVAQVRKTRLETCLGPIDLTIRVDAVDLSASKRPVANVYKAPVGGAQWVEGDAFGFEPRLVAAVNNPALLPEGRLVPMVYDSSISERG